MGNTNTRLRDWARGSVRPAVYTSPPSTSTEQFNKASAETLILRDANSTDPDRTSQLNKARLNMERKYKIFLRDYSQYSNVLLKTPSGKEIQPNTVIFDYPILT